MTRILKTETLNNGKSVNLVCFEYSSGYEIHIRKNDRILTMYTNYDTEKKAIVAYNKYLKIEKRIEFALNEKRNLKIEINKLDNCLDDILSIICYEKNDDYKDKLYNIKTKIIEFKQEKESELNKIINLK